VLDLSRHPHGEISSLQSEGEDRELEILVLTEAGQEVLKRNARSAEFANEHRGIECDSHSSAAFALA
jgi:hypothetical protein